jgi:pilus retraction protein PilT
VHVNDLLKIAVESGASDLHLKVGSYPMMRLRGTLTPASEEKRLDHEDMVAMAAAVLPTGHREKFKENHEVDLAYSVAGLGRFRCNAFQQRGTIGMIFRVIPMKVASIDDLTLPAVLKRIAAEERGLVLVTGTTGSGKSTTLAAMIDEINSTRTAHVMTVEDPIEYLHRDNRSIVNQREIGVDTHSFSHALRSALRQDPDVILVGEMRDFETIETALLAAETGHLVFSTLHTLDAAETINRIIAVFPPHQQKRPRARRRGPDQHRVHPRLHHGQGEDAPDPRRDRPGDVAIRDADLRSIDLQPVRAGADLVRGGAAVGVERRRVQAARPGHLHHCRHGPRSDGPRGRRRRRGGRPARDYAVRGLERRRGAAVLTVVAGPTPCDCSPTGNR